MRLPKFTRFQAWLDRIHPYARLIVVASTLAALILFWLCADYLRPDPQKSHLITALVLFLAGVLATSIAAFMAAKILPAADIPPLESHPTRSNGIIAWIIAATGILMLLALAEMNSHLLGIDRFAELSHRTQLFLLIGGTLLLVAGLGGELPRLSIHWKTAALLIVISLLGLFWRLWKLETAVHQFIDEANFSTVALYFYGPQKYQLLRPEIRGFPMIYAYLQFQSIEVWGRTLIALRFPSVIFGVLTIPAVYLLAYNLFDRKIGLIAAAFMAAFPPHLQFSRLGLNNIADPLFGTLAFGFLAQGFRTNRRLDYAAAGAALGLTQYFYEGGRLLFPGVAVVWVALGLLLWRPRPQLSRLLIAACAALIVAAPIYLNLYSEDLPIAPRLNSTARDTSDLENSPTYVQEPYLESLRASILVYTSQPEEGTFYYGGERGLVVTELLPLLFLGLALVAWNFYKPAVLLLIWMAATIVGTSLLRENLPSARFVVSFPALVILMAVGLRYAVHWLWSPRIPEAVQNLVLTGIVSVLMALQINYYFGTHLDIFNDQFRSPATYDGQDALFRSTSFPPGTQVYIISDETMDRTLADYILRYLNGEISVEILSPQTLSVEQLAALPATVDKAFFIEPLDRTTFERLQQVFSLPSPQISPFNVPLPRQLVLFYLPANPG